MGTQNATVVPLTLHHRALALTFATAKEISQCREQY